MYIENPEPEQQTSTLVSTSLKTYTTEVKTYQNNLCVY